jgi:hypothetical protein
LLGVGFERVERGVDATGEDFGIRLTLETLNPVVRTVADEGMQTVIRHATIVAAKIGASKAAGIDVLLVSTPTFALGVRANIGFGT